MSAEANVDSGSIRPLASSKGRLANSSPFGYGAFATTLMTVSLSMLGIRNVENQALFIANLCFLAGLGLLISAQWEMVRGNTFAYTTLIAFAFYYGGYGFLLIPSAGIVNSYGGKTEEYFNAFGFYLAAAFATNVANVIIYGALEFSYIFNCSANFAFADGHVSVAETLTKIAGGFGLVAAFSGFYVMASESCGEVLPFPLPLGDLSRHGFFPNRKKV
ncbi:hypothetical protein CORC01_02881 [Colletotrichum orchidophilum]|uniref:Uncharacterized protein n=1 Tax=Colletotrichum orchidophilum TaxID=1209926 RepID=A0A1G4BJM3_9PEZI|nr:uncharacterized protein CORC01_02881 [Colletotrichum orchidophilum]OHF01690.1 hypothetical protein CORC01_02881 [Colletotrichum orchidophilum]